MKKLIAVAALLISSTAAAGDMSLDGAPRVDARVKGPGGFTIVASTGEVLVDDAGPNFTVRVPLRPLTTGIRLRDAHMRDVLGVDAHPEAVLVLRDADIGLSPARGTLRLHGVERQVSVVYEAVPEGSTSRVRAQFSIDMSDFGITPPSYMGLTVQPQVTVEAVMRLRAQ